MSRIDATLGSFVNQRVGRTTGCGGQQTSLVCTCPNFSFELVGTLVRRSGSFILLDWTHFQQFVPNVIKYCLAKNDAFLVDLKALPISILVRYTIQKQGKYEKQT